MQQRRMYRMATRTACMAAVALSCTSVFSQSVSKPVAPVSLVAGTCVTVPSTGAFTVDWNPGFEHAAMVTGLKTYRLVLRPLTADGTQADLPRIKIDSGVTAKPVGNDFFRLQVRLARLQEPLHHGTYQLVAVHAAPTVDPSYTGEVPHPFNTLESEHYCITVPSSGLAKKHSGE